MVETAATDDATLVAQAASGSEHAFRTLYRAYVRPVYWLAHGLVGNAADAEDVTQETFLVAWRKLPGLELAGDSLLPWLVTICRFQAANRIRTPAARSRAHRRCRRGRHPVDGRCRTAGDRRGLRRSDPARGGGLSPLDRDIFRLCATEGYAYQAAAEELGVAHGVVRNRLSRIRTRLRTVAKEST